VRHIEWMYHQEC